MLETHTGSTVLFLHLSHMSRLQQLCCSWGPAATVCCMLVVTHHTRCFLPSYTDSSPASQALLQVWKPGLLIDLCVLAEQASAHSTASFWHCCWDWFPVRVQACSLPCRCRLSKHQHVLQQASGIAAGTGSLFDSRLAHCLLQVSPEQASAHTVRGLHGQQ